MVALHTEEKESESIRITVNTENGARQDFLSPAEVAEIIGVLVDEVTSRHQRGHLLAITINGGVRYPAFQFSNGNPREVIADLRRIAGDAKRSETGLQAWLSSPAEMLGDELPVDYLDDPAIILAAAEVAFRIGA